MYDMYRCYYLLGRAITEMRKIKVGAVSYLNTKPLIYGFQQGMMNNEIELIEDYPSSIAGMLLDNVIDVGLVPVAIIPRLKEHHIIGDYCIGTSGEVASVCLFSDVPIEQAEEVLLDYQSRTSVRLAKILLKEYWKVNPLLRTPVLISGSIFRAELQGWLLAIGLLNKEWYRLMYMISAKPGKT